MNSNRSELSCQESAIYLELTEKYGQLLGGHDLWKILGYPTAEAFRQACTREVVPINVFSIPRRRGKFARVRDVAIWLESLK